MDPGDLAPHSVLAAIAWKAPETAADLDALPELKGWFRREFGTEVTRATQQVEEAGDDTPEKPRERRHSTAHRRRGGRHRTPKTRS